MRALVLTAMVALMGMAALPASAQQYPAAPTQRSAYLNGTLHLTPGERAIFRQGLNGGLMLDRIEVVGQAYAEPPASGIRVSTPIVEPGTVVLSLGLRRDLGSFLRIENGLGQTFRYDGYMVVTPGSPPRRTPVCAVPPGGERWERWPIPVNQAVAWALRAESGPADCDEGAG